MPEFAPSLIWPRMASQPTIAQGSKNQDVYCLPSGAKTQKFSPQSRLGFFPRQDAIAFSLVSVWHCLKSLKVSLIGVTSCDRGVSHFESIFPRNESFFNLSQLGTLTKQRKLRSINKIFTMRKMAQLLFLCKSAFNAPTNNKNTAHQIFAHAHNGGGVVYVW